MFQNFIFDFDGTLSDSYPVFVDLFTTMLHEEHLDDTPEHILSYLKVTVGYAFRQYPWKCPANEKLAEFAARRIERTDLYHPMEGAADTLQTLKDAGCRNFLYTHTGLFVYDLLDAWHMKDLFTGFIDASMHFPAKPDPTALEHLCRKYRLIKESTLMIGDRDIDCDAAHNADLPSCLFDPDHFYPDYKADYSIQKLTDLIHMDNKPISSRL